MPKQNTKPSDYPQAVIKQIELLAQNIVIARKRRHETQAQWAKKLGVSQPTMARIERGDPSVAMTSYVMCMWLINQAAGLADLISPQNDHASLEREVTKVLSRDGFVASGSLARLAEMRAAQTKPNIAEMLAAKLKPSPAEMFAAQTKPSPVGTNNAKIVAGLAALLAKAELKSK